jgi:predicted RNA-binding Zn ribbon-like protein
MQPLALLGGRPALDFVNTVDPRTPAGRDFLVEPDDLIAWARHAGLVDRDWEAAAAGIGPRASRSRMQRAVAVRELLYGVLSAAAQRRAPSVGLRRELAGVVAEVRQHETIAWSTSGWTWQPRTRDPFHLLERLLVDDALDLLLGGARVRMCESPTCGWLFLDTTKNHTRRWCSMATCGNCAKARRHRQRKKGATA